MRADRMRGFTLVEMMVAMALTSIITGVVIYGFSTSQRASSRALGLLEIHGRLEPALTLLNNDVSKALFNETGSRDIYAAHTKTGRVLEDGGGAKVVVAKTAGRRFMMWFRFTEESNYNRCELVFPTTISDPMGSGESWVLWEARRDDLGSGRYRLRLSRRVSRFIGNNFFTEEGYQGGAPPDLMNIHARLIAGEMSNTLPFDTGAGEHRDGVGGTVPTGSAPDSSNHDIDRYFGPAQILYDVRETAPLDRAPIWNLFPLSTATTDNSGSPSHNYAKHNPDTNMASKKWGGSNAWNPANWEHAIGVHVDLEAYATGRLLQSVRFKRSYVFPEQ